MMAFRSTVFLCALAALAGGCRAGPSAAFVDADARFDRAARLKRQGRHVKAAEAFASFADQFEHDTRADYAQYLCGEEYRLAGRVEQAVAAYDRLFEKFPQSRYLTRANQRCLEIAATALKSDEAAGVEYLEQLISRSPFSEESARAHKMLGDHFYGLKRFGEARLEYDAVATETPESPLAPQAALGAALCEYRQIDRPARNMAHLVSARRRLLRLRTAPLTASEMALVDRYLAEVINLGAERQMLMAQFHLKQGQLEPALRYLRDIVENYPKSRYYQAAADLILYMRQQSREVQ